MALTPDLLSPLEDRVRDEACRQEAVDLLQSWIDDEEDIDEQKETARYLVQALDEGRPSYRKLFPPELKDVTW